MSFCDVCHHQNDFGFEKRVRNFSFVNFEKKTSHPKHICIDWKKKILKGEDEEIKRGNKWPYIQMGRKLTINTEEKKVCLTI